MNNRILIGLAVLLCSVLSFASPTDIQLPDATKQELKKKFDAACNADGTEKNADQYHYYRQFLETEVLKAIKADPTTGTSTDAWTALGWIQGASKMCANLPRVISSNLPQSGQVGSIGNSGGTTVNVQNNLNLNPPSPEPREDCTSPYNDCDFQFQLLGGVEQSGLSSLTNRTNAFVQAFTESPGAGRSKFWGRIRLVGTPQEATDGIITTFTDAAGQLQKQDWKKVGQAVDLVSGISYKFWNAQDNRYSLHWVAGGGFTSPLNSGDVVLRYQVPAVNTFECATLRQRYSSFIAHFNAVATSTTNCLENPTGTAIQQIAFSNQDRSNFLGKWGVGLRTITRFCKQDSKGDCDPEDQGRSTQRGMVDVVFGQDAALTGGIMRNYVFKIDAVHPLPFGDKLKFLYLFGSAGIRLSRNVNLDPLILKTPDPTAAVQPAIPSPSVLVMPLRQANRDFFRIGIALDFRALFNSVENKGKESTTTATSGSGAASGNK